MCTPISNTSCLQRRACVRACVRSGIIVVVMSIRAGRGTGERWSDCVPERRDVKGVVQIPGTRRVCRINMHSITAAATIIRRVSELHIYL